MMTHEHEPRSVWIVTSGRYASDVSIHAVHSSEEQAQVTIERLERDGERFARAWEWPVDDAAGEDD
jgi:hypothetical protein